MKKPSKKTTSKPEAITPPDGLTARQWIFRVVADNSPTSFAAVQVATGYSATTVRSHLHRLKARRFVTWDHARPGTLRAVVEALPEGER